MLKKIFGDKSIFEKLIIGGIILNILFIIFGIITFINMDIVIKFAKVIVGIYFILFGILEIIEYMKDDTFHLFKNKIFMGIIFVLLGFFIIINPFKILKIVTFTLGLYLIALAINKALEAIKLKKYKFDGWLLLLTTSVMLLIFGIFIAINPMKGMDVLKAMAIFVILSSILELCNLVMVYARAKEIKKILNSK